MTFSLIIEFRFLPPFFNYKWATINDIKDIDDTEIPIYLLEKALEMYKTC